MTPAGDNLRTSSEVRIAPGSLLIGTLTAIVMLAFAANSLFARLAFQTTTIDATSFTCIRIVSGALTLFMIVQFQGARPRYSSIEWLSAVLLFIYAAAFSFAYRNISVAAGALVLFAAAQLLMISYGMLRGERASIAGLLMALGGITAFLAPSAAAPPMASAALMAIAGFAWGGFSLLGRASESPIAGTASSFILAVPLACLLLALQRNHLSWDFPGALYALLSGTFTSAMGYAIWYWVRVRMTAISAAAVQLSVPVLSAVLGAALLHERIAVTSALSAAITLGGIAVVTLTAKRKTS